MPEIDYSRIERIAKDASNVSFSRMEKTIEKCIDNKFESMGMEDPAKVRKLVYYGEQCMENKRDLRKGFLGGIGAHAATICITLGLGWLVTKGGG